MPDTKLPPCDIDMEQATLGALLIDPDAIIKIAPVLNYGDFYLEKHGWIYRAILEAHRKGEIDFSIVAAILEQHNKLVDAGGTAYLTQLVGGTVSALHVDSYATVVKDMSAKRRLLVASCEIAEIAYNGKNAEEAFAASSSIIARCAPNSVNGCVSASDAVGAYIIQAAEWKADPKEFRGMSTGFADFDTKHGGLKPGLYTFAAPSSMGKTALALCMALNMALTGKRVGIRSMEMTTAQMIARLVAYRSDISTARVESGLWNGAEMPDEIWDRIVKAGNEVSDAPIYILDHGDTTGPGIVAQFNLMKSKYDIDVAFLDYVQLVSGVIGNNTRELVVAEAVRGFLECAKTLKIPFIQLSQFSRGIEQREDKKGGLEDLRESGAVGHSSDVVVMINNPDYWEAKKTDGDPPQHVAELFIAKDRLGPSALRTAHLRINPTTGQFRDETSSDAFD